jgi:peptidoglycan/LPS O-acetylase OafA/YrhL
MSNQGKAPLTHVYPGIEVLRGFAAISVLVLHVIDATGWQSFPSAGPLAWFRVGWLGVDIFFVISGLVITLAAFRSLQQHPEAPARHFLLRRFARIAPLYYLSLGAYLCMVNAAPLANGGAWFQLSTHGLFIHNLFPTAAGAINHPTWTIGAEMQLYVLVALLIPVMWRLKPFLFGAVCLCLAIAYRYAAHRYLPEWQANPPAALMSFINTQTPGWLDRFGFGMVLAFFVIRGGMQRVSNLKWIGLFFVSLFGLYVCEAILSTQGNLYWSTWLWPTFFRSIAALVAALLVWAAIVMPVKFEQKLPAVFIFFGKISYGIYLWHAIVIPLLQRYWPMPPLLMLFTTTIITVVLASVSWVLIEKPIISRVQQRLGQKKAAISD